MNDNSNDSVKNTERSDLDAVIKDVKIQIRRHYAGYKEQIQRTGNFLKEKKLVKERDICFEIKSHLKEEIEQDIISVRTIDRCCPDEWKRKTKPKKERQLSFFEGKNKLEQSVTANVRTNITPEGQFLQQELGPYDGSKKIEEQRPEELATDLSKEVQHQEVAHISTEQESVVVELQQLKMENKQQRKEIKILRDELNKLKAKGEVWIESHTLGTKERSFLSSVRIPNTVNDL